jgi:RNA polymerase sigma-70 factor (ECF subfamily)
MDCLYPSDSGTDFLSAVAAARAGSSEDLGRLLVAHRDYLVRIAVGELPVGLRGKLDAADVVQDTFLEAQRDFAGFRGRSEAELFAWLRQILRLNVLNAVRRYRDTEKRAIDRERPLDMGRVDTLADDDTPGTLLAFRERDEALARALARLAPHYRQVIRWRSFDQLPFEEIGRRLQRSSEAARRVWIRAVARLQALLRDRGLD